MTDRGTTNGNSRGGSPARRVRRAWLIVTYAADVPDFCCCYRCGVLLFNPDDNSLPIPHRSIDRIIPGCKGGTYRRNNIRPACGPCNSETGGKVRR